MVKETIRINMMERLLKIYLILMVNVAVMGAPAINEAEATITNYEYQLTEDGYFFEYSTSNGIQRQEIGEYIQGTNDDDNKILRVVGSYSYTDDKGEIHEVKYGANENGSSFLSAAAAAAPALTPVAFLGEEITKLSPYGAKRISTAALASLSG